jgi:hypothetical protein
MRIVLTESQYDQLLIEGRLEDLIAKYQAQLGNNSYKSQIEEFYEEDPSPTKKYFTWMSKIFIDRELKGIDTDEYNLIEMIKYFDKNIHKFEKKDIYQYTYDEFVNKYEDAILKISKKELETTGVEKLYGDEGDRYILVRPKNKEASCKYGANTKWCISSNDMNYFDNYSKDNLFFFVIDKERIPTEGKKKSEAYFKVAIQYIPEKHLKWDNYKSKDLKDTFLAQSQKGEIRFWNAVDDQITQGTVTKYIPKELIVKFIKLIKEYTYKVYLDYYNKMEQISGNFDKKKLTQLKKLVKEKYTKKDQKWREWVYAESTRFVENTQSMYENMKDFTENAGLELKSFDDFLNFMGIEEKYNKSQKESDDLEKIFDQYEGEYERVNKEYTELEKQSRSFKEKISFRS